jgi:hypothetical protein
VLPPATSFGACPGWVDPSQPSPIDPRDPQFRKVDDAGLHFGSALRRRARPAEIALCAWKKLDTHRVMPQRRFKRFARK